MMELKTCHQNNIKSHICRGPFIYAYRFWPDLAGRDISLQTSKRDFTGPAGDLPANLAVTWEVNSFNFCVDCLHKSLAAVDVFLTLPSVP